MTWKRDEVDGVTWKVEGRTGGTSGWAEVIGGSDKRDGGFQGCRSSNMFRERTPRNYKGSDTSFRVVRKETNF